ncbi:hypothetical protein C8R48DRAFT_673273 [Suillus tomentosus]|nr:hypothetical protein C8R48DRAFT_673273 [Suillus tomentosus]
MWYCRHGITLSTIGDRCDRTGHREDKCVGKYWVRSGLNVGLADKRQIVRTWTKTMAPSNVNVMGTFLPAIYLVQSGQDAVYMPNDLRRLDHKQHPETCPIPKYQKQVIHQRVMTPSTMRSLHKFALTRRAVVITKLLLMSSAFQRTVKGLVRMRWTVMVKKLLDMRFWSDLDSLECLLAIKHIKDQILELISNDPSIFTKDILFLFIKSLLIDNCSTNGDVTIIKNTMTKVQKHLDNMIPLGHLESGFVRRSFGTCKGLVLGGAVIPERH